MEELIQSESNEEQATCLTNSEDNNSPAISENLSEDGGNKSENTSTSKTFKSVLQAKKRLQAYSSNKVSLAVKKSTEQPEEPDKMDKVSPKKNKKDFYPDEKFKSVIQEIEAIKQEEKNSSFVKDEQLKKDFEIQLSKISIDPVQTFQLAKSEDNQFKKALVKSRNYRKSDVTYRSPSVEDRLDSLSSVPEKESYPKNWLEYKEKNFSPEKDIKMKLKKANKHDHSNKHIFKFLNFEVPSPHIELYKYKSDGIEYNIPFKFIRETKCKPHLTYSVNFKVIKENYFTKKQVFDIIPRERQELIEKLYSSSSSTQPSNYEMKIRKWYPKSWKKADNVEGKLLENSVGLSFLQSYSDGEDNIEENEVKKEETIGKPPVTDISDSDKKATEKHTKEDSILKTDANIDKKKKKKKSKKKSDKEKHKGKKKKKSPGKKKQSEEVSSEDDSSDDEKSKKKKRKMKKLKKKKEKTKKEKKRGEKKSKSKGGEMEGSEDKREKEKSESFDRQKIIENIMERIDYVDKVKSRREKQIKESEEKNAKERKIFEGGTPEHKDKTPVCDKLDDIFSKKKSKSSDRSFREESSSGRQSSEKNKSAEKMNKNDSSKHTRRSIEKKKEKTMKKSSADRSNEFKRSSKERRRSRSKSRKLKEENKKEDIRNEEVKKLEERLNKHKSTLKLLGGTPPPLQNKDKSLEQGNTPDTDGYNSHWESEDDNPRIVVKEKISSSWESDEEIFERSQENKHTSIDSYMDGKLEIPLNIKPFSRRTERSRWDEPAVLPSLDDEINLLKQEGRNLNEERRRLELEKAKIQQLELRYEDLERKSKDEFETHKSRYELDLQRYKDRTKQRYKENSEEQFEKIEVDLSKVKTEKVDSFPELDNTMVNISSSTDFEPPSVLENEYEEFMKAVSSSDKKTDKKSKKKSNKKRRSQSTSEDSSAFDSSVSDSSSSSQEKTISIQIKQEKLSPVKEAPKKLLLANLDELLPPGLIDAIPKAVPDILPNDIPLPKTLPVPAPVPSPKLTVDQLPKPLLNIAIPTIIDSVLTKTMSPVPEFVNPPLPVTNTLLTSSNLVMSPSQKIDSKSFSSPNLVMSPSQKTESKSLSSSTNVLMSPSQKIESKSFSSSYVSPSKNIERKLFSSPNLVMSPSQKTENKSFSSPNVIMSPSQKIDSKSFSLSSVSPSKNIERNFFSAPNLMSPLQKIEDKSFSSPNSDILPSQNIENKSFSSTNLVISPSQKIEDKSFPLPNSVISPSQNVQDKNFSSPTLSSNLLNPLLMLPSQNIESKSISSPNVVISSSQNIESISFSSPTLSSNLLKSLVMLPSQNMENNSFSSPNVVKSPSQHVDSKSVSSSNLSSNLLKSPVRRMLEASYASPISRKVDMVSSLANFVSPLTDASIDSIMFDSIENSPRKPFNFTIQSKRSLVANNSKFNDESDDENENLNASFEEFVPEKSLNYKTQEQRSLEVRQTKEKQEKDSFSRYSKDTARKSQPSRKRERSRSPRQRDSRRSRSPRRLSPPTRRRRESPRSRSRRSPRRDSPRRRHSPERRKRPSSPRGLRRISLSPRRKSPSRRRSRSVSPRSRPTSPKRVRSSPRSSKDGKTLARKSPANTSPLEGLKKSVADSTISNDLLPQPTGISDDYTESPITRYYDKLVNKAVDSPKRISLDMRINQVLGLTKEESKVENTYTSYQAYNQYSGQYPFKINVHQPPPPLPNREPVNKVVQVGNMLQIVPTENIPLPEQKVSKEQNMQKILQVGNMLQIVPQNFSPENAATAPDETKASAHVAIATSAASAVRSTSVASVVRSTTVATAMRSTNVATPVRSVNVATASTVVAAVEKSSAEDVMKQMVAERRAEREKRRTEREKRRKEKEKRRKEKEKERQMKLKIRTENMIKKALQMEQEEEEGQESEVVTQWPPVNISFGGVHVAKEVGKSILLKSGSRQLDQENRKRVQFADGVRPGEGTSPSGGEELSSPTTAKKLPKEKRYVKIKVPKKVKKKKVKVKVVKRVQEESDEEDNLPPPSPPPGSPPPHLFPPRVKTHTINNIPPQYVPNYVQIPVVQNSPVNYQALYRPLVMPPPTNIPPPSHFQTPPPPPVNLYNPPPRSSAGGSPWP